MLTLRVNVLLSNNYIQSSDFLVKTRLQLRICSCLACVYRVMDARRKFGEHERCVRVVRRATLSY